MNGRRGQALRHLYDQYDGTLLASAEVDIECGVDFCGRCGCCLACYDPVCCDGGCRVDPIVVLADLAEFLDAHGLTHDNPFGINPTGQPPSS